MAEKMFRNILFFLFIQDHVRSGKHGMHIYFCMFSMYNQWLLLIFFVFYVWYVLLLIISAYVILFEIPSKIFPGKYNPNFTYWFVIRTFSQNIFQNICKFKKAWTRILKNDKKNSNNFNLLNYYLYCSISF